MRRVPRLLGVGAMAGAVVGPGAGLADAVWGNASPPALTRVQADDSEPRQDKKKLNTIAEVFAALEACWMPPDLDQSRAGMQITVMLAFKRSGELLGKPRITYESPGATEEERATYRAALAQALARCLPLRFTDALGNALAGRPMTLRFIDNRKLKQAGTPHDRES
jgi:hypothetical protein